MEPEGLLPRSHEPTTGPVLNKMKPVHELPPCLPLLLGLSSGVFPSGFPTKTLYAFLICPKRATCLGGHILRDVIILTVLVEEYRLSILLLRNFLQPLVTSFRLDLNIALRNLLVNTHNLRNLFHVRDTVPCSNVTGCIITLLYINLYVNLNYN